MSLLLIGKIQTLLDRLTSGRATALDAVTETRMARLDAAVTSRASAATALSTSTWTGDRAGYLDLIPDAVVFKPPADLSSVGSEPLTWASLQSLFQNSTRGSGAYTDRTGTGAAMLGETVIVNAVGSGWLHSVEAAHAKSGTATFDFIIEIDGVQKFIASHTGTGGAWSRAYRLVPVGSIIPGYSGNAGVAPVMIRFNSSLKIYFDVSANTASYDLSFYSWVNYVLDGA